MNERFHISHDMKKVKILSSFSQLYIAQLVTGLATDASQAAGPGAQVHSWPGLILSLRLIMKYFLRSFSSLPLNYSRRVVVSYKRKYVHEVLVNCLFKLAQEKVWLGELTVPP